MNLDFTGSTLFLVLLLFAAGLVCIIKGGDIFVDAATWIAEASGIPKFIIGATVVSFATTMPEMLVSVFSALEGNADIAIGNAVGSVTANTGLIMCLSLICMECTMPRRQYAVKAVLLLAAIAVLFGFTRDGQLSILESVLILVIFVCFIAESLVAARREQSLEAPEQDARPKTDGRTVALNIGKFVFGAAAIVLGAQLLIDNGTALAQMIGVPDAIIGATMIAIGTSLPELVTTITAIRKKQSCRCVRSSSAGRCRSSGRACCWIFRRVLSCAQVRSSLRLCRANSSAGSAFSSADCTSFISSSCSRASARKKTGAGLRKEAGAAVCFGNAAQMQRGMQDVFACLRKILETGVTGGYNTSCKCK